MYAGRIMVVVTGEGVNSGGSKQGEGEMINWKGLNGVYKTKIIVPTFVTKVTEYLCSGWVFFRQFSKESHF